MRTVSFLRLTSSRAWRATQLCVAGAALAACGGSDSPSEPTLRAPSGSLVMATGGLPSSLTATFLVRTADGKAYTVASGDTLENLTPGVVTVTPAQPSAPGVGRWVPFDVSYSVSITDNFVAAPTVQYAAAASIISVTTSGLPVDAVPLVRLTAPDGAIYSTSAGTPFVASLPGVWTAQGQSLLASQFGWVPSGSPVGRSVLPGDTAFISIAYVVSSGAVAVTATGLPNGVTPTFTVSRGAASYAVDGPGTVPDLSPGVWTIATSAFSVPGMRYTPAAPSRTVNITPGVRSEASFAFIGQPIVANLAVAGAYLTQAVQTFDGATPLIAGREALLRVFLTATETNQWRPTVRATLFRNGGAIQTVLLTATGSSVDTFVTEGNLAKSWNVRLDGALIAPGLSLLVEADPERLIREDVDVSDNVWPRGGTPQPITVQTVPVWKSVLVPVIVSPRDIPGNVTESNKDDYTSLVRRVMPIHEVNVAVRAPYTASVAELQSADGNRAWTSLLNEVNALRAAEGSAGEYWYGVVNVGYTSGVAGYGYVPGRTAIGWDRMPSATGIAAHEWGHNFGRQHAPCGSAGNSDSQYPFAGGVIGSSGWNSATDRLVAPTATDIMGYCGNQWVSAYNWTNALGYRTSTANAMQIPSQRAEASAGATDRLLVWGSITNGRVDVEPAFLLAGTAAAEQPLPGEEQSLRVEALDADGAILASVLTAAAAVDHATDDVRAFAVTLPLSPAQQAALASLRVRDLRQPLAVGRRARTAAAVAAAARALGAAEGSRTASIRTSRAAVDRLRVEWDTAQYPRAMVRDALTGRILAMPRASGSAIAWSQGAVDVILSDGVRSQTRRIQP